MLGSTAGESWKTIPQESLTAVGPAKSALSSYSAGPKEGHSLEVTVLSSLIRSYFWQCLIQQIKTIAYILDIKMMIRLQETELHVEEECA